jgi:hypothetical protein
MWTQDEATRAVELWNNGFPAQVIMQSINSDYRKRQRSKLLTCDVRDLIESLRCDGVEVRPQTPVEQRGQCRVKERV